MAHFNRADVHEIIKKQKTIKPKIEDVIPEYLDGDMKKAALDFVTHLRGNKIKPVWCLANAWKANYKSKTICYIRMPRGSYDNQFDQPGMPEGDRSKNFWVVTPYLDYINEYERVIITEGLQSIIWDNLYQCNKCHDIKGYCGAISKTIYGREIKNLCSNRRNLWFYNPDGPAINCIKRLLELEQNARIGS